MDLKSTGERGNSFLRRADRLVGIPAVAAIGFIFRAIRRIPRSIPTQPSVIGLLKASGIGDAVILSGVISDLRRHYPDSRLVLFSGTSNFAFARLLDDVDEVVALPIRRPLAAIRAVRERHLDIMIDFGMWPRLEALIAVLSGAKWVTGVRTPGQHRHFAYDAIVDHSDQHEIVNYRNLVAPLGLRSTRLPSLSCGAGCETPLDEKYAIFHLWPGGSNAIERSWPEERWLELGKGLTSRGFTIVLTGGPDDVTRTNELLDAWSKNSPGGIVARSIAGIKAEETIVWLRHARGAISVNTGLLHLAAAVGTPVVALNGPTSGVRWGPLGPHTRCVSSPMVPSGYLNLGWETDRRFETCMEAITTSSVLAAWDDLMVEVGRGERPLNAAAQ
jgi:ADP-heptose:LPS heptosyltransferase